MARRHSTLKLGGTGGHAGWRAEWPGVLMRFAKFILSTVPLRSVGCLKLGGREYAAGVMGGADGMDGRGRWSGRVERMGGE